MITHRKALALLVAVLFLLAACGDDDNGSSPGGGSSADCHEEPFETEEGVVIEDVECGDGAEAENGKLLTVHYVGTLEDGTQFDSSRDRGQPFPFVLGVTSLIEGWELGMEGLRVGGIRKLTIPPELAYGAQGQGAIPPNATINFEIELLEVSEPTPSG